MKLFPQTGWISSDYKLVYFAQKYKCLAAWELLPSQLAGVRSFCVPQPACVPHRTMEPLPITLISAVPAQASWTLHLLITVLEQGKHDSSFWKIPGDCWTSENLPLRSLSTRRVYGCLLSPPRRAHLSYCQPQSGFHVYGDSRFKDQGSPSFSISKGL